MIIGRFAGWQILDLAQYLSEARRLEQRGELVEAIWCYETILRDPRLGHDKSILHAAGLGLGLLLIGEARLSDDPPPTTRLINRAISVLGLASHTDPADPASALALAEAHILRFHLTGQTQDLLAANIQLDRLSAAGSAPQEAIEALRALIHRAREK